jgi:hypothetical protein
MRKNDLQSVLWKHSTIMHDSRQIEFEVEVTGTHKTVLERMTNELVRIKHSTSDVILNSKNDWTQPPNIRVVPITGNRQETQVGDSQPGRNERTSRQNRAQYSQPHSQPAPHSQPQSPQDVRDNTLSVSPGDNLRTDPKGLSRNEVTDGQEDTRDTRPGGDLRTDPRGQSRDEVTRGHERTNPRPSRAQRSQRSQSTQLETGPRSRMSRDDVYDDINTPGLGQDEHQRTRRPRRTREPANTSPETQSTQGRRRRMERIDENDGVDAQRGGDRNERRQRREEMRRL